MLLDLDRDRLVQAAAALLVGIGTVVFHKLRRVAQVERPVINGYRKRFNARLRKLSEENAGLTERVGQLERDVEKSTDRIRDLEIEVAHVLRLAKGQTAG